MTITIKDNNEFPIPKTKGRKPKYDFDLEKLEVDKSIHIKIPKEEIKKEVLIVRNRVGYFKRSFNNKVPKIYHRDFTVRSVEDGIGIWRIKWKN